MCFKMDCISKMTSRKPKRTDLWGIVTQSITDLVMFKAILDHPMHLFPNWHYGTFVKCFNYHNYHCYQSKYQGPWTSFTLCMYMYVCIFIWIKHTGYNEYTYIHQVCSVTQSLTCLTIAVRGFQNRCKRKRPKHSVVRHWCITYNLQIY